MSRAYRIAASETVRQHIRVSDGVQTRLELLPILDPGRMSGLLEAELAKLGFQRDGAISRRVEQDSTEIAVDLEQGTVTVRLHAEAEVDLSRRGSAAVYDKSRAPEAERALRTRLRQELAHAVPAHGADLRQQATDALELRLRDLLHALDGAVNRATAAALKEKAASLGEIEEIQEDSASGSLTIRVRL